MSGIKKIGIFDSGVGGLTVYGEIVKAFPGHNFVYLGDTARVPYGIRSPEIIRKYALENALFLIAQGAQAIVVACNTVTATSLEFLQSVLKVPVFGVIEPSVDAALQITTGARLGIIATPATINSQAYQNLIAKKRPDAFVLAKATPLLVPIAEENIQDPKMLYPVFEHYFNDFTAQNIDTLILGCTHYPLLKSHMDVFFRGHIHLVDSAHNMTKVLSEQLGLKPGSAADTIEDVCVTDAPERAAQIAKAFLGREIAIHKVVL